MTFSRSISSLNIAAKLRVLTIASHRKYGSPDACSEENFNARGRNAIFDDGRRIYLPDNRSIGQFTNSLNSQRAHIDGQPWRPRWRRNSPQEDVAAADSATVRVRTLMTIST